MSDPNPYGLRRVQDGLSYFQFPGLSAHRNLIHGVFTRHNGVSNFPFDTLNVSFTVGDHTDRVKENIRRIQSLFSAGEVICVKQLHGDGIFVPDENMTTQSGRRPSADAMITAVSGFALLVKQADCQGVIIYDPRNHVVANVHCGWKGNVRNILGRVVERMKEQFGCNTSDLIAAIGPSLGPCCAEFVSHREIFPKEFRQFMVRNNHFDLWDLSRHQLVQAGLRAEKIEIAGICTRCRTDLFYSYRGEGVTGRFGTIAMLR
ncbi:MAG: peptidoglycan editing factor PgeF [Deltaproteobacteria bacterium]|nr:MAG: peptidoglycan editing factor PgeF [Deltaproteobacteria bacterium]